MRSSFIDWLFEQQESNDDVGILSRWILSEADFEPLELNDILERLKEDPNNTVEDYEKLRTIAIHSLVDYASMIASSGSKIKLIEDEDIDKERLNIALRQENYEEAARLRDRLNKLKNGNKEK